MARRKAVVRLLFIISVLALFRVILFVAGYHDHRPDAWRMYRTIRTLVLDGVYETSRNIGRPVVEYSEAFLYKFFGLDSVLLATILISLAACVIFFFIAKQHQVPHPYLLTFSLGLTPVFLTSSVTSLDYMWSLFFALAAYMAILHSKIKLSGILLGLAIGSRITAVLLLLPYMLILYLLKKQISKSIFFGAVCIMVAGICYVPAFYTYTSSELVPSAASFLGDEGRSLLRSLETVGVGVFGQFGAAAFALALPIFLWKLTQKNLLPRNKDYYPYIWFIIYCGYVILFIYMPSYHLPGYLLMGVPFLLLAFAAILPRTILVGFCISLVIAIIFGRPSSYLIQEIAARQYSERIIQSILHQKLEKPAIVVVGSRLPKVDVHLYEDPDKIVYSTPRDINDETQVVVQSKSAADQRAEIRYVYLLDPNLLDFFETNGYHIYFVKEVQKQNYHRWGIDLAKYGQPLVVPE